MSTCTVEAPTTAPLASDPNPAPEDRDEILLRQVRAGEPAAYAELYERHEDALRRYARSLVPANDVDDLVAESFMAMLRAINGGKGPVDQPLHYLMVVVRNGAATYYKRRARASDVVDRLTLEPQPAPAEVTGNPHLEAAFQALSPRWRQVIWWSEVEDLSPSEIGARLDLSPAAASALAYRARRALRAAYLELSEGGSTSLAMR